jgi:hypothetical protein
MGVSKSAELVRHGCRTGSAWVPRLVPPPVSPAPGPLTDWGEIAQTHDDRNVCQASPDENPSLSVDR